MREVTRSWIVSLGLSSLVDVHERRRARRQPHDGQDPGAYTIGAILLRNGNAEGAAASDDAMYALFAQLLDEAEKL